MASDRAGDAVPWADLTQFQTLTLAAIAELERGDTVSYGLAIKRRLERDYDEEINHGRLYPNLDDLAGRGLVEKDTIDRRTNAYTLTADGRRLLADVAKRYHAALGGGPADSEPPAPVPDGGGDDR